MASLYRINYAIALIHCTMVAPTLSETWATRVNNRCLRPGHGIIVSHHVAIALIHCAMVGPAFSEYVVWISYITFSCIRNNHRKTKRCSYSQLKKGGVERYDQKDIYHRVRRGQFQTNISRPRLPQTSRHAHASSHTGTG